MIRWLAGTLGEWDHKGEGRRELQFVDSQLSHFT